MSVPSIRWNTPRESIQRECERRGKGAVVAGCMRLLDGREADPDLVLALGGPPARWVVTGEPPGPPYWLRVWAARGLLWAWDEVALEAVEAALDDDAWRVREMALKVVGRHKLEELLPKVGDLQDDPSARVRVAATRTLSRVAPPEIDDGGGCGALLGPDTARLPGHTLLEAKRPPSRLRHL